MGLPHFARSALGEEVADDRWCTSEGEEVENHKIELRDGESGDGNDERGARCATRKTWSEGEGGVGARQGGWLLSFIIRPRGARCVGVRVR